MRRFLPPPHNVNHRAARMTHQTPGWEKTRKRCTDFTSRHQRIYGACQYAFCSAEEPDNKSVKRCSACNVQLCNSCATLNAAREDNVCPMHCAKCERCGDCFPLDEFNFDEGGERNGHCDQCRRAIKRFGLDYRKEQMERRRLFNISVEGMQKRARVTRRNHRGQRLAPY